MSQSWKLPAPGDIVWCLFPEVPDIEPGPKPRPAVKIVKAVNKPFGFVLNAIDQKVAESGEDLDLL